MKKTAKLYSLWLKNRTMELDQYLQVMDVSKTDSLKKEHAKIWLSGISALIIWPISFPNIKSLKILVKSSDFYRLQVLVFQERMKHLFIAVQTWHFILESQNFLQDCLWFLNLFIS